MISSPQNTFFPVYESVVLDQLKECSRDPGIEDYEHFDDFEDSIRDIKLQICKLKRDLTIEDYNLLKNDYESVNNKNKFLLFNTIIVDLCCDENVLSKALEVTRSIPSYYGFTVRNCVDHARGWNRYDDSIINEYGHDEIICVFNKCKFLIDLGEDVNTVFDFECKATALDVGLDLKSFGDPIVELLIASGAVVYNPISKKKQDRVNRVMQPIIETTIKAVEFLKCMNYFMYVPNELKHRICSTMMGNIKLAPEVLQKIFIINKMTKSKISKVATKVLETSVNEIECSCVIF